MNTITMNHETMRELTLDEQATTEGGLSCEETSILLGLGGGAAIGGLFGGLPGAFTGAGIGGAVGILTAAFVCR
jgi:hypothetical protein